MPWFRVDDGFANCRQVLRIPRPVRAAAVGLWTLAGTWSAKELTDGFVPDYTIEEFACDQSVAEALVSAGLWETVEGGWQFIGWEKYQPTKDQVEAERAKEAERKRRWREAKAKREQVAEPKSDAPEDVPAGHPRDISVSETVASENVRSSRPDPTRPDPVPKGTKEGKNARESRGTRLPDDWKPTPELVEEMRAKFPRVDLAAETEKFVDYWTELPGAKALKTSWAGTWRNWIRRAAERAPVRPSPSAGTGLTRHDEKGRNYLIWGGVLPPDQPEPPELKAIS